MSYCDREDKMLAMNDSFGEIMIYFFCCHFCCLSKCKTIVHYLWI